MNGFSFWSSTQNILIQSMSSPLAHDAWPPPLAHCGRQLVEPADDRVTIAELSDEPVNGYKGTRMLYTALVPMEILDPVMTTIDGLGQSIRTLSEDRSFADDGTFSPTFWMYGLDGTKRFESLVNSWGNGTKEILLPDNAFLMHFKLFPRFLDGDEIAWDDFDLPLRDIVRSTPVSSYDFPSGRSGAKITVRRDYLDRYLTYKNCAAVATYYDQRHSTGDADVAALIKSGVQGLKQPGRQLWFKKVLHLDYEQLSEVWGTALVLVPSGLASYRKATPILTWPDRPEPVDDEQQGVFKVMETVFVKDDVLIAYEDKPEYEIHAINGSVGYENRWSVGFCHRISRNHIELELRKLYEGAPADVIVHFHKFAVAEAIAKKDEQVNGKRNVGQRAEELIDAYLAFTQTVSELSAAMGLPISQETLCKYDSVKVDYSGWWKFDGLKPFGNVVPLALTRPAFLDRCKNIFSVMDDLQQAPLRRMAIALGIDKELLKEFKSMKLLSCICQLAHLGIDAGFNLIDDSAANVANWTPKTPTPKELESIFALQVLRVGGAHNLTQERKKDYLGALTTFGITENQCAGGWGFALDKVYDRLILDLNALNDLILKAQRTTS